MRGVAMIDLSQEELLSLSEASAALPRIDGRRPHVSTVWRWCRKGVRGVRLEYVRLGHRICTSREALNRFANTLARTDSTVSGSADSESPACSTPARQKNRARAIADAEASLEEAGI